MSPREAVQQLDSKKLGVYFAILLGLSGGGYGMFAAGGDVTGYQAQEALRRADKLTEGLQDVLLGQVTLGEQVRGELKGVSRRLEGVEQKLGEVERRLSRVERRVSSTREE